MKTPIAALVILTACGNSCGNGLLALYPQLQQSINELHREVGEEARQSPQARRLMTHPGVGLVTALVTEVFLGDPNDSQMAKRWQSITG